ncbi:hypothetical protein CLF_108416 [Clonorchis sinensis]|uniref:Uncharacterized protein n=1 Tax=Clonorchis sinensis TaxID=79923 RepID=G7YI12_CLOSI|nr:hypothetical protein CLF_108416 [Clonorchis sinensis]
MHLFYKFPVLHYLLADILLGHDFLKLHKSLKISFDGDKPSSSLYGLIAEKIEPFTSFAHLDPRRKPITIKPRRYSEHDKTFIASEVKRLLVNKSLNSQSPSRAQVLVTTNERQKKRMVVDYSQHNWTLMRSPNLRI